MTTMTTISSYVEYLPPVLWSSESDLSQFLGQMLRIFEKILTGIPDEVAVVHNNHKHDPVENTIDKLLHIFNPWRTPRDFLPWLASWVALTLREDWNEYQQRKLIAEMVSIYQQRGLKKGLYTCLDIYAITQAKPRIAIDDGEALFRATFLDDGMAQLHAIAYSSAVTRSSTNGQQGNILSVMLHPSAIAVDSKNNYIVADEGGLGMEPALWKVSSTGEIAYKSGTSAPIPWPIYRGDPLEKPIAVVIDSQNRYNVLDIGRITSETSRNAAIYRFVPPDYSISTMIEGTDFPIVHPVDMILDRSGGFIVLDRGLHPFGFPPEGPAAPKVVVVTERPSVVKEHPFLSVVEPTALVMDSEGCFIIADAKDQRKSDPADLIRVDPTHGWEETSLLEGVAQNPLIFPTGLVFESPQSLFVCDTGVRWGFEDQRSNRAMAEPAAIYRVDLSQSPPTIIKITHERKLVNPSKMRIDRKGKLILTDRGESLHRLDKVTREWRAMPNEFGVVVHFSQQRPSSLEEQNRIRQGIADVIEEQRPGNTSWFLEF